ncbi:MAG: hypothetical protein ACXVAX_05990 [Pseudobdellovibrio sp.]
MVRSKKFNSTKTDLQNLEARLSQLRLALRAKVKRKSNAFRSMLKSSIVEGDLFDNTVKSLCDVKFDSSEEFQHFFDISRQLVKMITVDLGSEAGERTSENNFMSNDFKTEMDILRIIKEMVDISAKINHRVVEHNRTSSQKLPRVDPIMFAAITEVNRVFKGDEAAAASAGAGDGEHKAS